MSICVVLAMTISTEPTTDARQDGAPAIAQIDATNLYFEVAVPAPPSAKSFWKTGKPDTFQQALRRVRKTLDDAAGGASSSVSSEAAIRAAPRHDAQDLGKAQTLPGEAKPLERLGEAQLQGVDPEKAKALIETQLAEIGARRAAIESELMAIKDRRGEIDLQLKRVRGGVE